jgi:hypothetical protein
MAQRDVAMVTKKSRSAIGIVFRADEPMPFIRPASASAFPNASLCGQDGFALVTSGTGVFWSTVHNTPRSASSAIFCNSAALALSGSARASRRYLTARSWFLSLMLEVFTCSEPSRNQRPSISLMPTLRVNSGTVKQKDPPDRARDHSMRGDHRLVLRVVAFLQLTAAQGKHPCLNTSNSLRRNTYHLSGETIPRRKRSSAVVISVHCKSNPPRTMISL